MTYFQYCYLLHYTICIFPSNFGTFGTVDRLSSMNDGNNIKRRVSIYRVKILEPRASVIKTVYFPLLNLYQSPTRATPVPPKRILMTSLTNVSLGLFIFPRTALSDCSLRIRLPAPNQLSYRSIYLPGSPPRVLPVSSATSFRIDPRARA